MSGGRPRLPIGTFGHIETSPTPTGWRARTWVRDLDGRRRRAQATDRTQRKAEALLKARISRRAGYGAGGMLSLSSTFDELCELWLADLAKRDLSDGTKQNYRDDLRLHVRPVLRHYTLGEITTGRIEWFLREEYAVSYSRAKHSRTLLSQLFAFALRHDALPRNPLDGTSELKKPKRTIRAMTIDQVRAIRVAAAAWRTGPDRKGPKPDGKVRDICEVLLGTSTRPGEVLALRPCDITETKKGMIAHVQGTVVRRKGVPDFRQDHPKTDASNRRIAVPEFAATVIRERIADMGEWGNEVTIFHNRYGRVLPLNNLGRTFRAILEDAGLADSGVTLRWYRRTGATVLARGLGADAAATYLGHTNVAITEGHYIAPDESVDMSPADVLDLALRAVAPDPRLLQFAETDDEENLLDELDRVDEDEEQYVV